MRQIPPPVESYLIKRAVQGPWVINGLDQSPCLACIVIPALGESESLPHTLRSLETNPQHLLDQTRVLVVVNNRASAAPHIRHDNQATLRLLESYRHHSTLRLHWVDASSSGVELPEKQGVGLARKIGMDLSLQGLNWDRHPFIVSLDADTLVTETYLVALFDHFSNKQTGAVTIPFRHAPAASPQAEHAIRRYERYLRSYTLGLAVAGSPYAFISIGSAFACAALDYARAGGMNRRLAGEDFYFLQQVAKTSCVTPLNDTRVMPSARISDRVPFGTGRVVDALSADRQKPYTLCAQSSFAVLQQWLQLVSHCWQVDSDTVRQQAHQLSPMLLELIDSLDFRSVWTRLQCQYQTQPDFLRAFHVWFDALRTRQLLTRLNPEANQDELTLINDLLLWCGQPSYTTPHEQLALLELL
ncbi:MAG: hypothetical protein C0618_07295 [Desulfuromonas sp.]|nr:MAG: hypothetical protein C0618_07295 [Desulfuromonas sp.]